MIRSLRCLRAIRPARPRYPRPGCASFAVSTQSRPIRSAAHIRFPPITPVHYFKMLTKAVRVQCTGKPDGEVRLTLTPQEQQIFSVLLDVVATRKLHTTIRVAGGWVRDKLLGRDSHDIDIALDDMKGAEFAVMVAEHLKAAGHKTSSVGVIQANPEQSKHLETATTRVLDMWIDFVHLRTETYDAASRIPVVAIGTPSQDADRRDFTINSLFYNVTADCVEDFTGRGLDDLRGGLLRTPLPPRVTFLDDPLRVIRAVRFASRLSFRMVDDLRTATRDGEVQAALLAKVSRERVGIETETMLLGPRPVASLRTLRASGLLPAVFPLPPPPYTGSFTLPPYLPPQLEGLAPPDRLYPAAMLEATKPGWGEAVTASASAAAAAAPGWLPVSMRAVEAVAYLARSMRSPAWFATATPDAAAAVIQPCGDCGFYAPQTASVVEQPECSADATASVDMPPEHRRTLLLAALLHPLHGLNRLNAKGKPEPCLWLCQVEGLKRKHKESEDVAAVIATAHTFASQVVRAEGPDRLTVGLSIRKDAKELWPLSVYLAAALHLQAFLFAGPSAAAAEASASAAAASAASAEVPAGVRASMVSVLQRYTRLYQLITSEWALGDCWGWKPLVNGKELMRLLELRAGPEVGKYVEEQTRWQMLHPAGTVEECLAHLRAFKDGSS